MISEDVIKQLADAAESYRGRTAHYQRELDGYGDTVSATLTRLRDAMGPLAVEYDLLAEVARLLATDERFRDALGEARDRQAAAEQQGALDAADDEITGEQP